MANLPKPSDLLKKELPKPQDLLEKKNPFGNDAITGSQTSFPGSKPFLPQVPTELPSVLLSDEQKQQREKQRIGERFETTLLNIPTEFGKVAPTMRAAKQVRETLPQAPEFRRYGEIKPMQPVEITEGQRIGESLTKGEGFQEVVTDKLTGKKTALEKQIEAAENAFRAYQGDEIANQVQSYIPPEETLKIKQELGFGEKMSNAGSNFVNRLERFVPNTAIAVGQTLTTLLGEDLGSDAYRMITSGGNADFHRMEAFDKLAKLDSEYKYSKGLIQSVQDLDLGGVAAAVTDAVGSLVSTVVTSAPTAGLGLYSDMVGGGLYDYNSTKANRLGISVDELYETGQNEFFAPAIINGIAAKLEDIGLKGIKQGILSNIKSKAGQKAGLIFHNSNKEGFTEWTQSGLEAYSNSLAQGKNPIQAGEEAVRTMFSKKGAENYLMGTVAAGAAIGGGRILKGIVSSREKKKAADALQKIEQQQQELNNPAISEESRVFIFDNIKNNVKQVVDAVYADVDESDNLGENQKKEVFELNKTIQALEIVANDSAVSEETKASAQTRIDELKSKVDSIIATPEIKVDKIKKDILITPETSSNYANMTEDDKGNFVFFHVGNKGYDKIKVGTGDSKVTSREEASALAKVGGLAMYYTDPNQSERQSAQGARYAVKVPKEKVYDFNTDKLNLIEEAERRHNEENPGKAFDLNSQLAYVTKIAGEKGFDMVVAQWNNMTRAQTTKELSPIDIEESDGNIISKKFDKEYISNKNKGFVPVIPISKAEKLQKVYNQIEKLRNKEQRYDDLYRLYSDYNKYSQDEITELINNSDLPQEIKEEYNNTIQSKEEGRRSEQTKSKQDAVQVETAGQVPVLTEAPVGEKVAKGKPEPKTKVVTEEGSKKEVVIDKESIVKNSVKELERVKSINRESEDGATFNIDGTKYDGTGLVVPVTSLNTTINKINPQMLADFVEKNKGKIGDVDTVKFGIYKFPNSNQISIDLNIIVPEKFKDQAIEFGRLAGQESLFDLETYENVKTGSDGKSPVDFTDTQFKEISKALKDGRIPNVFAKESKDLASKIRGLKINLGKGTAQSNIAGLPIALYNSVVEFVATSVEAGSTIAEAIKKAIDKFKLNKYEDFDSVKLENFVKQKDNPIYFQNIKNFASESSFDNKIQFKAAIQKILRGYIPELKKIYGSKFNPSELNDTTKKYLTDILAVESLDAIRLHPEAIGWYDEKTTKALQAISLIHPEIETDPAARGAFILALAVMSNGNKVDTNFDLAEKQYDYFKKNGRFNPEGGFGIQQSGIKKSLIQINSILDSGIDMNQLNEFLTSKFRAGDLKVKIDGKVKSLASGELANEMVYGAVLLGPKIGNGFYMNLWGKFDQLTMDRWFMRTWGRLTGTLIESNKEKESNAKKKFLDTLSSVKKDKNSLTLLNNVLGKTSGLKDLDIAKAIKKASMDKSKRSELSSNDLTDALRRASNNLLNILDGEKEAPANGAERKFIRDVFEDVQKRLKNDYGIEISMADLQAVLWYPEKILYESFKSGETFDTASEDYTADSAPDYFNSAKKLAIKKGIDENKINQATSYRQRSSRGILGSGGQEIGASGSISNQELAQRVKGAISGKEIVNTVRKLKIDLGKGTAQSNIAGLPIALYNAAIETIALGLEAGLSIRDAINKAIEKHKLLKVKEFDKKSFVSKIENAVSEPAKLNESNIENAIELLDEIEDSKRKAERASSKRKAELDQKIADAESELEGISKEAQIVKAINDNFDKIKKELKDKGLLKVNCQ